MLRAIDPAPLRSRYAGHVSEAGERPELQWLKINRLRIDPSYQREIARKGEYNILAIAAHFHWARGLRDQCQAAGVAFFFKQWGEYGRVGDQRPMPDHLPQDADMCTRVGKKAAGRLLDGVEHNAFPIAADVCESTATRILDRARQWGAFD